MKIALISLAAVAAALGIIAAVVVFYPTGSYQPVILMNGSSSSTTIGGISTSTASTTPAASTTASGPVNSPYAVSWNEGHGKISVTGASLKGNNLTLSLIIQSGDASSCAPSGVRFAPDESGTLKAPNSQTCSGGDTAGSYNELLVFTVSPTATSFIFTTGNAANIFFTVAPNAAGGMNVAIPQQSG